MKNGKRKCSMRAADGAIPVSPYSLRGIGQGLAGAYGGAVDATSHAIEAVAKPFSHPPGYTPALVTAPAPVAAPVAPAPPTQLGGMNLGAIQRREAAAGLADGTPYVSPFSLRGIGQSLRGGYDSLVDTTSRGIEAVASPFAHPPGYTPAVVPSAAPAAPVAAPVGPAPTIGGAVNAIQAHQQELQNLADGTGMVHGKGGPIDDKVDAKLSPGESVLPADTTAIVGPENLKNLIAQTHTPAHLQKQGVPPGGHVARRGLRFANGIVGMDVTETPFTEGDANMFGQRPPGTVPSAQPQVPGMTVTEATPPTLTDRVQRPLASPEVPGMRVSYPMNDYGPGNPNVASRMGPQRPGIFMENPTIAPSTPMGQPPATLPTGEAAAPGRLATLRNATLGSPEQWQQYAGDLAGKAGAAIEGTGTLQPAGRFGAAAGRVAGAVAKKLGPAGGVYEAYQGAKAGDGGQIALGTADTVAALGMATPAAPIAGAYLTGRGIYEGAKAAQNLTDTRDIRDAIGGTINSGLRKIGLGVDDDAYLLDKAAVNSGQVSPVTGASSPAPAGAAPVGAPPVAASNANPTDSRLQGAVQAPPLDNSVIPGGAQAGKIQRRGNSFTNTGSFMEDERSGGISPQNDAAATNLSNRSRAESLASSGLRGGMDSNLPAGAGLTIPGVNAPASQYETELAARNASVHSMEEGRGMNANQRRQAALEQSRIDTTRRGQDLTEGTTRRGQDLSYASAREGNKVSMRGQDLSYDSSMFGHNVSAAGNRARLAYDMGKDNRDYNLRAAEFGQKRDESAFNQSEKADQALQHNLEARYQTTDAKGNVVPDAQKIGEYRATVNATVPALAKELEATGNPQAIAKAADLRKRGVAALDPEDHARLTQLFDLRDRMAQARGLGPNQGTFSHSDNLLDYRQLPGQGGVERRTFGGNRIVTPAGSVSVNDLRYADAPANAFFPDFNKVGERNLTRGLRTE